MPGGEEEANFLTLTFKCKCSKLQIVEAFHDVLPCSSGDTSQTLANGLIVQLKSEQWDGEFLDLKEGDETPPDKSVLKIVYGPLQVYK